MTYLCRRCHGVTSSGFRDELHPMEMLYIKGMASIRWTIDQLMVYAGVVTTPPPDVIGGGVDVKLM